MGTKVEILDKTVILKPVDGVVLTRSAVGRYIKESFLKPEEANEVCSVLQAYANKIRSALKLKKDFYGWCDGLEGRFVAGRKGPYVVIVECSDVTGDPKVAEEFMEVSEAILFGWSSFLCKAYALVGVRIERIMERWPRPL